MTVLIKEKIAVLVYNIPKQYKVSTNKIYAWMHWRQRKKIADYYHNISRDDCIELWHIDWKVDLDFKYYWRSRYLDSSNTSFISKTIEDSLVKNKLLTDDSNSYIWKVTYESILIDPKERKKQEWDYLRLTINRHD